MEEFHFDPNQHAILPNQNGNQGFGHLLENQYYKEFAMEGFGKQLKGQSPENVRAILNMAKNFDRFNGNTELHDKLVREMQPLQQDGGGIKKRVINGLTYTIDFVFIIAITYGLFLAFEAVMVNTQVGIIEFFISLLFACVLVFMIDAWVLAKYRS